MICIVTALSFEAQPLIEHYNLTNIENSYFRIYKSEDIMLIISGVGKLRSAVATTYVLSQIENIDRAAAINIGLCGAYNRDYAIGTPILINKIADMDTGYEYFPDILFSHDMIEGELETHAKAVSRGGNAKTNEKQGKRFVDMEAAGFFEAASSFLPPHRISCIKIVSDYLEGERIHRKDVVKAIEGAVPQVQTIHRVMSQDIENMVDIFDANDIEYLEDISRHLRLTVTQRHELFDTAFKYKLRTGKSLPMFNYVSIRTMSKKEGKRKFEQIKESLWRE